MDRSVRLASPNTTLVRTITMFCGSDNIMYDIPSFGLNVENISRSIVSPMEYNYGYE